MSERFPSDNPSKTQEEDNFSIGCRRYWPTQGKDASMINPDRASLAWSNAHEQDSDLGLILLTWDMAVV